jgi:hypothetical protein
MRSWIGLSLALLIGGSVRVPLARAATDSPEMVHDGGFENGEAAGIGRSWVSESYGSASVQFDLSTDKVQFGKYCQHIRVEAYKDGNAQIRQLGMNIHKGQSYSIVLWMRGNLSVPVLVGFRKHGAPYTFYLRQEVRVTPAWQRFTITGVATGEDENAGLYLAFGGNGDLWIDHVSAVPEKPGIAGS